MPALSAHRKSVPYLANWRVIILFILNIMYKSDNKTVMKKIRTKIIMLYFRCLPESKVNVCEKEREKVSEKVKFRA